MARHALLIGVSRFTDSRLAALNAPAGDVQALAAVLRDPQRGGFDSVAVSVDEEFLPMRDRLGALFNRRDPDDLLLLYYSGHGILDRGNQLYLATPGADLDDPESRGMSAQEIRGRMDRCRAERQIMVLDCCHSGAFAAGAKGAGATAVTQETFETTAAGRYVLAAADALQFAWDGDSLKEGAASERKLSRFTSWLVDGIGAGQASPDDEQITMDALFRYVCRRARAEGSAATPQRYVDRGTGDLVIARNPAAAGPAWQDLIGQLAHADWSIRAKAAEELGRMARQDGPRAAEAREALLDRLGAERDFKVRGQILKILGLAAEEERPANRGAEGASPKPPPPPDPAPTYELNDRERAVLKELTIPQNAWGLLPAPVLERVRLYALALRNTRWLLWATVTACVFDLGIVSNLSTGAPDAGGQVLLIVAQIVAGLLGVLPLRWIRWSARKIPPPPAPAGYEAAMARYTVVKMGLVTFDLRRTRQLNAILLAAGILSGIVGAAVYSPASRINAFMNPSFAPVGPRY